MTYLKTICGSVSQAVHRSACKKRFTAQRVIRISFKRFTAQLVRNCLPLRLRCDVAISGQNRRWRQLCNVLLPCVASARPKFTATVDLPTPPFPEAIPITVISEVFASISTSHVIDDQFFRSWWSFVKINLQKLDHHY